MEHLPSPRGRHLSTVFRTRYVAEEYNGTSFLDWPAQSRFRRLHSRFYPDEHGIQYRTEDAKTTAEYEIFLQTWLYFGLLHVFWGDLIKPSDFVTQHGDSKYLTTERLPALLQHLWSKDEQQYQVKCLEVVHNTLMSAGSFVPNLDPKILISIVVLAEGIDPGVPLSHPWATVRHRIKYPLILPKHMTYRLDEDSLSAHLYADQCQRLMLEEEHQTEPRTPSATYQHCCKSHDCEIVHVDHLEVQRLLEDDHIALLKITREPFVVEVVSSADCPSYVAISHVWSKGLGNPQANALPMCQLQAVQQAVDRTFEAGFVSQSVLWLDTLCCPTNSSFHRDLCIKRMERIYRQAECVLIIEPPLSQRSISDYDQIELITRFLLSSWTTRLWTFQEGLLAERLCLLMKDSIVDIDRLATDIWDQRVALSHQYPVLAALTDDLRSVRPPKTQGPRGSHLMDLLVFRRSTRYRQLSVAGDETLCLSTCFGLAQDEVVAAPVEERMAAFWRAFAASGKSIPRSIIFFYGERVSTPGYRWSPASIVNVPAFYFRSKDVGKHGELQEDGLVVKYPGLSLTATSDWSGLDWRLCRSSDGGWYSISHAADDAAQYYLPIIQPGQMSTTLIIEQDLPARYDTSTASTGINCLAGTITHTVDGVHNFEPHTSCDLYRPAESIVRVKERVWQALQALNQQVEDANEALAIVQGMHEYESFDPVWWLGIDISLEHFQRVALETLESPPLEIEQLYSEEQQWRIG